MFILGWWIDPVRFNPPWTIGLALPFSLLSTILVFMDQQITTVIVNRKENKLKKSCGQVLFKQIQFLVRSQMFHIFHEFWNFQNRRLVTVPKITLIFRYHLDLLVVAIALMICSFCGLPWFVAATVLSITHVNRIGHFRPAIIDRSF